MERPPTASLVRYGIIAVFVATVITGYPAKWFRTAQVAEVKPVSKRAALPDFTLPVIQGGKWQLSESSGKVVLLNFWATWCGPCREETPELVQVYNRYRSRGFEIAGISLDEEPHQVVPGFIRTFRVPYPVLLPGTDFALAGHVEHLPTTLILDRKGRIAGSWIGQVHANELTPAIERLLGEQR
jgi:cytochrome c biogenesis protein CcmG, thiol:disulfide interchange protein DsbE